VTGDGRGTVYKWLALGLAMAGIGAVAAVVLAVEHSSALLALAVIAALAVFALPLAAYFLFRPR
jgi:drug/metabolite transporter (DMT)-like permease